MAYQNNSDFGSHARHVPAQISMTKHRAGAARFLLDFSMYLIFRLKVARDT